MNRAIFAGSLVSTVFLIVGSYLFPNNPVMWLASTSIGYTIFRGIMVGALLTVLFTAPPRKLMVRLFMGAMGATLLAVGLALSMGGTMHLLDIVLFLELGAAFGIEALELNEEEIYEKAAQLQQAYWQHALATVSSKR